MWRDPPHSRLALVSLWGWLYDNCFYFFSPNSSVQPASDGSLSVNFTFLRYSPFYRGFTTDLHRDLQVGPQAPLTFVLLGGFFPLHFPRCHTCPSFLFSRVH